MSLAVCLLFDPAGDRAVRAIWRRLESEGVETLLTHTHRRHRPHLSYAVAVRWDPQRVREEISALPCGGPFELVFHGMLAFARGRVALAPAVDSEIVRRQERVAAAVVGSGAELHRYYGRGSWIPHVSLATRAKESQLPLIARAVSDTLPLRVTVESAMLIDSGTGDAWPLPRIP